VVDRAKDMILVGGENVYCSEVEAALLAHPGVAAAAAFGQPNPVLGEVVAAAVVLHSSTSDIDMRELIVWCSSRLAHYKVPAVVHQVDALPTTGSGKVLKNELRACFASVPAVGMAATRPGDMVAPGVTTQSARQVADSLGSRDLAAAAVNALESVGVVVPLIEFPGDAAALPELLAQATYILPLVADQPAALQVRSALQGGVAHAVILADTPPTQSTVNDLKNLAATAAAKLVIVLLDSGVMASLRLFAFALLDSKLGLPQLAGVLLLPSTASPVADVTPQHTLVSSSMPEAAIPGSMAASMSTASGGTILVRDVLGDLLGESATTRIDNASPLLAAGLTSTSAVALTGQLEQRLGVALPPTLVFDFPTIAEIGNHLAITWPRELAAAVGGGFTSRSGCSPHDAAVSLVSATVTQLLGRTAPAGGLDPAAPLLTVGLDSTGAVALATALEAAVGVSLPPTLAFDHPSISEIAAFLCEEQLLPSSFGEAAATLGGAAVVSARPEQALAPPVSPVHGAAGSLLVLASSVRAPRLASTSSTALMLNQLPGVLVEDAVSVMPLSRWDVDSTMLPNELMPRFACVLTGVEMFDAAAVGVTAAEALLMDPQQRLMLEVYADVHAATAAAGLASR
jgi:acyl carrier protein